MLGVLSSAYSFVQAASDIEEEMAEMDSAAESDEEEAQLPHQVRHALAMLTGFE